MVDTLGLLLAVGVHRADLPDAEAAAPLLAHIGRRFPRLRKLWADGAFRGWFETWCATVLGCEVEIPRHTVPQPGFHVLPRRWVVERSLAWLSSPRRLAREYEELPECAEAQVYLASITLLLNRLAPPTH